MNNINIVTLSKTSFKSGVNYNYRTIYSDMTGLTGEREQHY